MTGPLVLAIDGSTRVCCAALLRVAGAASGGGWEVVGRRAEADAQGQARVLLGLVDEMLAELDARPQDLRAVVVGVGPGTFTGVRIAVATARGLALALSIPVWGVSTLSALAAGAAAGAAAGREAPWSRLVPVVDAHRQQVFFGVYEHAGARVGEGGEQWVRTADFGVCDRGALGSLLGGQGEKDTLVIGDARSLVGELPRGAEFAAASVDAERLVMGQELLGARAGLAREPGVDLGILKSAAPGREGDGAPERVKPLYVRCPDADVHITKMKDPWNIGGNGR